MTVLVALAWTATALADDPGLVDQYTEQVPTASGSSGGGGGPTHSTPLPGNVRTQLMRAFTEDEIGPIIRGKAKPARGR